MLLFRAVHAVCRIDEVGRDGGMGAESWRIDAKKVALRLARWRRLGTGKRRPVQYLQYLPTELTIRRPSIDPPSRFAWPCTALTDI